MDIKEYFKYDFKASLVVFLVALPLCLGIALASGAPLFSGLVAGIAGGIIVGAISASPLSVSGPAAGLATLVAIGITQLGSYEAFLLSVVLAGIMQISLGYLKAGSIGHFFPASVVRGMLAAIGLILILKQIPHATGYDIDFEGDENFSQSDGLNTFTEIMTAFGAFTPSAIIISLTSILVLYVWDRPGLSKFKFVEIIPGPLIAVLAGVGINVFFGRFATGWALETKHLVSVPLFSEIKEFVAWPDFSTWRNPQVYVVAVTIALVASLETLLNIEACDKLDPLRRMTPLNRELKAQGIANVVSGMLGGLPITSVVVRSSANIHAGARTKASAITHGIVLLLAVLLFPSLLRQIPLASLAGILIAVGYKLTAPSQYLSMFRKGMSQFLPFIVTILAVLLTNLLQGVFWGIIVAVFYILKTNFGKAAILVSHDSGYLVKLTKDVSFLNKSTLRMMFHTIPSNTSVLIDGSHSQFIDHDIKETISDFMESAKSKNISVELKNISIIS